jgi:hypothetical protein
MLTEWGVESIDQAIAAERLALTAERLALTAERLALTGASEELP